MSKKRVFICLLTLVMLFLLSACGEAKSDKKVYCPECKAAQDADATFCNDCGSRLEIDNICGKCGAENADGAKFCSDCGTELSASHNYPDNQGGNGNVDYNDPNGDYNYPIDSDGGTPDSDNSDNTNDPIDQSTSGEGDSACSICAGEGLDSCKGHECVACSGKGYLKCYGCTNGYTVYGPCIVCTGGRIDCTCDDGIKYYDKPLYIPPNEETALCDECEAGYVQCSLCKGSGKYGTISVGGYNGSSPTEVEKTCTQCLGAKKTKCTTCGGDGKVKPS